MMKTKMNRHNRIREVIEEVKKDCNISEHTHLCVRKIPKTDDELIGQLRGAQANIIKEIERRLDIPSRYKIENEETYIKVIDKWGSDLQLLMPIEEMSELTKAICKYNRKPNMKNIESIAEEVADVEITLELLKVVFSKFVFAKKQDKHFLMLIEKYRNEKMSRLKKRVEV